MPRSAPILLNRVIWFLYKASWYSSLQRVFSSAWKPPKASPPNSVITTGFLYLISKLYLVISEGLPPQYQPAYSLKLTRSIFSPSGSFKIMLFPSRCTSKAAATKRVSSKLRAVSARLLIKLKRALLSGVSFPIDQTITLARFLSRTIKSVNCCLALA
ncbi:hypothetical protein D3C85_1391660 [compost metagenome]